MKALGRSPPAVGRKDRRLSEIGRCIPEDLPEHGLGLQIPRDAEPGMGRPVEDDDGPQSIHRFPGSSRPGQAPARRAHPGPGLRERANRFPYILRPRSRGTGPPRIGGGRRGTGLGQRELQRIRQGFPSEDARQLEKKSHPGVIDPAVGFEDRIGGDQQDSIRGSSGERRHRMSPLARPPGGGFSPRQPELPIQVGPGSDVGPGVRQAGAQTGQDIQMCPREPGRESVSQAGDPGMGRCGRGVGTADQDEDARKQPGHDCGGRRAAGGPGSGPATRGAPSSDDLRSECRIFDTSGHWPTLPRHRPAPRGAFRKSEAGPDPEGSASLFVSGSVSGSSPGWHRNPCP